MATLVYLLCALTSVLCGVLLARSYLRNRVRLLLWSTLGFAGLAVNNLILFVDKVVVVDIDFSLARNGAALIGTLVLLFGLIWDTR